MQQTTAGAQSAAPLPYAARAFNPAHADLPRSGGVAAKLANEAYVEALARIVYYWGYAAIDQFGRHSMWEMMKSGPGLMFGILPGAPMNTTGLLGDYLPPSQRFVVTPNNDTFYGPGFADLRQEPAVIQAPTNAASGHYWTIQIVDAFSNVIHQIGSASRTPGGKFLLVGPDWVAERGEALASSSRFMRTQRIAAGLAVGAMMALPRANAQDADELAKQLSNPIASLISVPLQLNYDDGVGPDNDGSRTLLNIQPVIPASIGEDWNMISRTIVPVVYQEDIAPGAGTQFGTGDVLQSLFFSPKALSASGWTWGVGPALSLRTASDDLLGSDKWSAGPTAVVLKQTQSGWTYGALVNHLWSFAGDDDRADVSSTFLQPFVAKGLGEGRTITVNLESSYDWKGGQWSVPINLSYSKVGKFGSQLVSYAGGVRYYIEAPDGGAEWGLRFVFTLLYPRK